MYVGVLMRGGRPIIGGVFARPADRWPGFRESAFWRTYPYFLPCVIAASISVSAFVLAAIGLREVSNNSCSATQLLLKVCRHDLGSRGRNTMFLRRHWQT